ncbi:Type III pantothenate kinase [bacterium HR24]|jgi:type III pantothenate kinase|nr:Type III pantothenate kinase [bacterium HR24]
MLLALDIGNTNVTAGVFEDARLRRTWRLATDVRREADEYAGLLLTLLQHGGIAPGEIKAAVMCSVVPDLEPVFETVCRSYLGVRPLLVDVGVRTGLRVLYDAPRDVGPDRVADAVAALHLYGAPVIIVDLGTATVFDAVNRDGDYVGGAIAPGLGIAAEALFQRAARLYRVELTRPRAVIGRNTVAAMQSGIVYGYVALVEGMVARFREELGADAKVVATGGYAHLIAAETRAIDHVNPDLTLVGLRLIYEMNRD